MTNFIPIFPLSIIVYPGEVLNLHIFEPRYKQLIQECNKNNKPFGIPTILNDKLEELGTLVKIVEIVKVYDNGEMDIKTIGTEVFRILEFIKNIPEKLYSGAIVSYPTNKKESTKEKLLKTIVQAIHQLHHLLGVQKDFKKLDDNLTSYDIAHHAGLSIAEEYELLSLMQEDQRLAYLQKHLKRVLPIAAEMESLKEKIKLNGHFKRLSGFEFE